MYCMSKRKRTQMQESEAIELKGDYDGTGFGKHYDDCTLEEKKQRQINFFEDMLMLTDSRNKRERELNVRIRAIIYKLNTLKGEELEKCIDGLEPIGTMYPCANE